MDEEISQAYARLTAHEWAIEAMMTTFLRSIPPEQASQWLEEFTAAASRPWGRENAAVSDIEATRIALDGAEIVQGLAQKVRRRVFGP